MKKLWYGVLFIALSALCSQAWAQAPVNIVYPIHGGSYPVGGSTGAGAAYFTFSFSATCPGGANNVTWGVDGITLGKARFYDQYTGQGVWKSPTGVHKFWVNASCGSQGVKFNIL